MSDWNSCASANLQLFSTESVPTLSWSRDIIAGDTWFLYVFSVYRFINSNFFFVRLQTDFKLFRTHYQYITLATSSLGAPSMVTSGYLLYYTQRTIEFYSVYPTMLQFPLNRQSPHVQGHISIKTGLLHNAHKLSLIDLTITVSVSLVNHFLRTENRTISQPLLFMLVVSQPDKPGVLRLSSSLPVLGQLASDSWMIFCPKLTAI